MTLFGALHRCGGDSVVTTRSLRGAALAVFFLFSTSEGAAGPRALTEGGHSSRSPAWSPDGTRLAFETDQEGGWSIRILVVETGAIEQLTDPTTSSRYPAWSPDGRRIAFVCDRQGQPDLCVMDVVTRESERVIALPGEELWPAWSPDGQEIAFTRKVGETLDLAIVRLGETGSTLVSFTVADARWPRWSPDGRHLAFFSRRDTGGEDDEIYTVHRQTGDLSRITHRSGHDFCPAWSPAGDRLAVTSVDAERGRSLRIIGRDGREMARLGQGYFRVTEPAWSPDGRAIVYAAAAGEGQPFRLFLEPIVPAAR